jgi:hypothetical protein
MSKRPVTTIPVLMCIDVEPDKFKIDMNANEDWKGFEQSFEFFQGLRSRFQRATGRPVHYCWFLRMDPQIELGYGRADWVIRRYSSLIDQIIDAGDAIGLHVHAWQRHEKTQTWVLELGDQSWIDHCLRVGFESFRMSLNQQCRYFRFGDLYTNDATLALVEKLGAQVDLTLEPGQQSERISESLTPVSFDTSGMPRTPYRPARNNFRKPDTASERALWILPLTTGSIDWDSEVNGGRDHLSTLAELWPKKIASRLRTRRQTLGGFLERADGEFIAGWAYDSGRPDEQLEVEIFADQRLIATVPAATFRADVLADGRGNGRHCFNVNLPSFLADGKRHSISARVKGRSFTLTNSPLELKAVSRSAPTTSLNLSYDTWPLCRLIDNTLTSDSPYLTLVVRSDVITQADQRSNMEQTLSHVLTHRAVNQMAFSTPGELIDHVGFSSKVRTAWQ